MPTSITFLRHAQSLGNIAVYERGEAAYGDTSLIDCGLTGAGLAAAREARASTHEAAGYDRIYCSPARRCVETLLEVLPEAATMPVCLDWRLLEYRGVAQFNELGSEERTWPAAWKTGGWRDKRAEKETETNVAERVAAWWRDLLTERDPTDSHILVVSHAGPITMWCWLYEEEDVRPRACEAYVLKNWLS